MQRPAEESFSVRAACVSPHRQEICPAAGCNDELVRPLFGRQRAGIRASGVDGTAQKRRCSRKGSRMDFTA